MANDLVAKLGVDATAWTAGFNKAEGDASSFSSKVSSLFSVGNLAFGAVAAGTAALGGSLVIGGKGIADFRESLESSRKLSAVFQATGNAAGLTADQVADFASEMQQLTNFEDDATVASAAVLAAFTNIRGTTFTDTLKSAMDMSTIMGGDLKSNVELLGKAMNDPAEGMTKLARAGVQFTASEQEKVKVLAESGDMLGAQTAMLATIQSRFGGAAEAVADPWKQLTNNLGDVSEMIGSALVPAFNLTVSWINTGITSITTWGQAFASFGVEAAVWMENLNGVLEYATVRAGLFAVSTAENFKYLFTAQGPSYLDWFAQNWKDVFIAIASNTLTIFENIGTNIANAWTAVLKFFQGEPIQFNWTPLTHGFVSVLKDLPKIPDRPMTELEKNISENLSRIENMVASSMDESRTRLKEQFTNLFTPPKTAIPVEPLKDLDKQKKKTEKSSHPEGNFFAGIGSQEAAKIALTGASGPNKYYTESLGLTRQQLAEIKEARKLHKEAVDLMRSIERGTTQGADF